MRTTGTMGELRSLLEQKGFAETLADFEAECDSPLPTGFPELDQQLGGGFPRGEISECLGPVSSGCTSLSLSLLAQATSRGELAAYIDASGSLNPDSAEQAGVVLEHLLWVRCGSRSHSPGQRSGHAAHTAQIWKAANLVAAAGGFGLIVMDLIGLPPRQLRELQRSPWFGLRQTIAGGPAAVFVLAAEHVAGSVAAQTLSLRREKTRWRGQSGVSLHLAGVSVQATVLHQRRVRERKNISCPLEIRR